MWWRPPPAADGSAPGGRVQPFELGRQVPGGEVGEQRQRLLAGRRRVVGQRLDPPDGPRGPVRYRIDLDRLSYDASRRYAAELGPAGLVEAFTRTTSRWPEPGLARVEPARRELADALTHRLDVCRPLGVEVAVPAERMVAVLDAVVRLRDGGCRSTAKGLTLRGDDVGWRFGSGPEVHGSGPALLLGIGRRPAALSELTGPGLELLAGRIDARRRAGAQR